MLFCFAAAAVCVLLGNGNAIAAVVAGVVAVIVGAAWLQKYNSNGQKMITKTIDGKKNTKQQQQKSLFKKLEYL